MNSPLRAFGAAILAAAAVVLAACSPPNQQDTTLPKTDTASDVAAPTKTKSSSMESTSESTSESPTTAMDSEAGLAEVKVNHTSGIKEGDEIKVEVSGLDPTKGYYAAICAAEAAPGNPVPVCTGKTGDTEAQAWIKAQGGTVPLAEDGTATATLIASPAGDGIDCATDSCVVKIFGDHAQGFTDIMSVPVTFAK